MSVRHEGKYTALCLFGAINVCSLGSNLLHTYSLLSACSMARRWVVFCCASLEKAVICEDMRRMIVYQEC